MELKIIGAIVLLAILFEVRNQGLTYQTVSKEQNSNIKYSMFDFDLCSGHHYCIKAGTIITYNVMSRLRDPAPWIPIVAWASSRKQVFAFQLNAGSSILINQSHHFLGWSPNVRGQKVLELVRQAVRRRELRQEGIYI